MFFNSLAYDDRGGNNGKQMEMMVITLLMLSKYSPSIAHRSKYELTYSQRDTIIISAYRCRNWGTENAPGKRLGRGWSRAVGTPSCSINIAEILTTRTSCAWNGVCPSVSVVPGAPQWFQWLPEGGKVHTQALQSLGRHVQQRNWEN